MINSIIKGSFYTCTSFALGAVANSNEIDRIAYGTATMVLATLGNFGMTAYENNSDGLKAAVAFSLCAFKVLPTVLPKHYLAGNAAVILALNIALFKIRASQQAVAPIVFPPVALPPIAYCDQVRGEIRNFDLKQQRA